MQNKTISQNYYDAAQKETKQVAHITLRVLKNHKCINPFKYKRNFSEMFDTIVT